MLSVQLSNNFLFQVATCEDVVAELTAELQRSQEDNQMVKRRVETMRDENDIVSQRLVEKQQEVIRFKMLLYFCCLLGLKKVRDGCFLFRCDIVLVRTFFVVFLFHIYWNTQ